MQDETAQSANTSVTATPENALTTPPPTTETNQINNPTAAENTASTETDTQATPVVEGSTENPPDDASKKTPWFQRRIDQLTAEKWEERRASEALRKQTVDLLEQLAEARKQPTPVPAATGDGTTPAPTVEAKLTGPATKQMSDAEIEVLAEQRAEQKTRQRAFDKACNEVAAAGKSEYDDFDQSLKTFQMLGGIPTPLLEVITEMPNAHKVLYSLGKDPELAERVVKMSPTKQAFELARLERDLGKPVSKQVSSAPPPVRPIDAASRASENPETMSMDDFIKWREKNMVNKRK